MAIAAVVCSFDQSAVVQLRGRSAYLMANLVLVWAVVQAVGQSSRCRLWIFRRLLSVWAALRFAGLGRASRTHDIAMFDLEIPTHNESWTCTQS